MAVVGNSGGVVSEMPNLKIEIENDLDHKMETDDDGASIAGKDPESETEEGELVDDDDRLAPASKKSVNRLNALTVPTGRSILKYDTKEYLEFQEHTNSFKNPNGAFVTGVDIFSPEEQAKLDKRAKRFGIGASEGKVLNEKVLKKLYKSMGVKPTDKNIRAEALHMRGTEQMTTQEVFSYFKDYGPASLEWISDNSCNVVWLDSVSAARALLGLSVHITGQTGSDVRASQSDSDVEMESQAPPQPDTDDNLSEDSDAVPLNELGVEVPPGRWRRGAPHPLSPCPLLRFATTSDRSLPRPGFAKYGSHQFGGYVGLISESRKRRLQNALPSPLLFEDVGDEAIPKPAADETDNANPWGVLAKTWSQFDKARKPRPPSPMIERILPLPPSRMTPPPSPPIFSSGRLKLVARRRDRTGGRERISDTERDVSDPDEWRTRSKVPRMRMHADDEEKKVEKRLKQSHQNGSMDLRTRIGIERRYSAGEESSEPEQSAPEDDGEIPDLRVAVAADPSPDHDQEDTKAGIRLFQTGNVKSVLRGARGYDKNEDAEEEDDEEEDEDKDNHGGRVRSSVKRHRSRSREKRRHHRRHRKESSYHRSRRRDTDSDDTENVGKTMRSTIRRKSPERKESRRTKGGEHKSHESGERKSSRENRERRSPRHERARRDDERIRSEVTKKTDRKRHGESRSSRDLRSKIVKSATFEQENVFRSKSPLRIEIDNDEYYRQGNRD